MNKRSLKHNGSSRFRSLWRPYYIFECFLLSFVVLLAYTPPSNAQNQTSPTRIVQNDLKSIVYRMSEYYLLLLTQKRSLAPDAPRLDFFKRTEIQNWLSDLTVRDVPEPARTDLERCRHNMLNYLNNSDKPLQTLSPILAAIVDAEIDESSLAGLQDKHLTQALQTLMGTTKRQLMVHWGVQVSNGNEVSNIARAFVDFFVVANALLDPGRPIVAQVSLLSLDVSLLTNKDAAREFSQIYREMLQFSRQLSATGGNKQGLALDIITLRLAKLPQKFGISDDEITKYGGPQLLQLANGMRDLFK